jgi:hypothetical protein
MEIRTSDLYEAAYYLTKGITPHGITCRLMAGNITKDIICDFYFEGKDIPHLQGEFLRSEAAVNLALFRRCYAEVNNYANNAKRDYRKAGKGGRK